MKEKLLLLHGALGSANQFNSLKDSLGQLFDLHILSFEGHGGSASSNDFSIGLFTENVIDYLQRESIDQISVFGYSMGGYVAFNAALQIPEKINKISTLGTKFKWDMESVEREVRMLDPGTIEEKVPHYAEKLKKEHRPLDWKIVMQKTANMMTRMAEGDKLMDSDFKRISHQVVIGIGDLDNMVSYEESDYVSRLIPNSKLVKLEGVKHPIDKIGADELLNYITSTMKN